MFNRCTVKENALHRWFLASASAPFLAWSGSSWETHKNGIGVRVQILSRETQEEAIALARTYGLVVAREISSDSSYRTP
jgi:hypothetical protein